MNIDDLLKIQNKYVPVSQLSKDSIINAGEPITSGEVREQQNTYEVVKKCEALIEKTFLYLTKKGIPFDQITISSNIGFFLRLDYFNELKKYYQENDNKDENLDDLMKTLHIKVFPEIVPVNFGINTNFNESKDYDKDLSLEPVSGVVKWEKFVAEMNSLGYNIEFLNSRNDVSFFDYIMAAKQNVFDTQINITTDFGKVKKYTLLKM